MAELPHTVPEVDQVLARLRQIDGTAITLSHKEADWLLAEIDGGREAFGTVVQQKKGLEQRVAQLQRSVDTLLAMRGKP